VVEVARAFTGWTVRESWDGLFFFDQSMHDEDEKYVLGYTLAAGRGIEDGLQVIDILATHPSTARYIAMKLVRRFVSDAPPPSLVESAAAAFTATEGDIREVMRHILTSPEFFAAQGQKFRRPSAALVAMMRALSPGLQVDIPIALVWALEPMGNIPYFWHPPNGYPDAAGAWINTNGLLHRWNLAMSLALAGDGYFDGASLNVDAVVPMPATVGELVDAASVRILGQLPQEADRQRLIEFVTVDGDPNQRLSDSLYYNRLPALLGILMSSPYFQWY
jgi:uncharacterized protein (DUF1800 family)